MSWKVSYDGWEVDFDDLPPVVFSQLARAEDNGTTWWTVYTFPGGTPERLYAVIARCAQHAGHDPPPEPATMRDARKLLHLIERTADLEDAPYEAGNPPMPDAQATESSTGRSGSLGGPPT